MLEPKMSNYHFKTHITAEHKVLNSVVNLLGR